MAQYGKGGASGGGGGGGSQVVSNQPFDEAVELSDEEGSPTPGGPRGAVGEETVANQPFDEAVELSSEDSVDEDSPSPGDVRGMKQQQQQQMASSGGMAAVAASRAAAPPANEYATQHAPGESRQQTMRPSPNMQMASLGSVGQGLGGQDGGDDDESHEEGRSFDGGEGAAPAEGMYDPAEYANLGVSDEINELFQYITRYKPHAIELETKMRPFIPDYIPAVGDIDSFVKVPRPDGKADHLGLAVMDEPSSNQSDPTVLTLQLRAVTKSSGAQPMLVRSVEAAEKNPKAITGWISSIAELHRHKPAPSVRYSSPMPDVESLMQIWPAQMEELLETSRLPDADLQVDLASYVRIVCAMLDIPVHGEKLTESLHVLFTLFSDFKANVHFQQQLSNEPPDMNDSTANTFELE
uniref:Intraflagellar transport protein 46 homolog n=1 Tax=Haptolina ericina TaxID=156174 RepID=A0A7S3F0D0_9EUKA